jgi:hypothetical protein
MHDAACSRDDLVAAYEELTDRLARRRASLWDAYREACDGMSPGEYEAHEPECWSVLHAGLAGLEAEARVVQREFEQRMHAIQGEYV